MASVLEKVLGFGCSLVELTGGEPLLQDEAFELMQLCADRGLTVLLETSGLVPIDRVDRRVHIIMDLKCPDSGECDNNLWSNLQFLKTPDEIKFVIASRHNFEWTLDTIRKHTLDQRLACWPACVFGAVRPVELADWILASGLKIRMQLQLHKYIWSPEARGV